MSPAAPALSFRYQGAELDLFEKATNWKGYWSRAIAPHLRGDVLEVGAGIGSNTTLFARHDFRSWTCLEPDTSLAARIPIPNGGRHRVLEGTTASLATSDRYNSILYVDVLDHIEDDSAELARAAAHLRPGGRLVILTPAWQFLYSPFDASIGHYRRYSRTSLRAAAGSTHFDEIAMFYLDCAGMLASAANRLILRRALPTQAQVLLWDRRLVPLSRRLDGWLGHRLGKTLIGVWENRLAAI